MVPSRELAGGEDDLERGFSALFSLESANHESLGACASGGVVPMIVIGGAMHGLLNE